MLYYTNAESANRSAGSASSKGDRKPVLLECAEFPPAPRAILTRPALGRLHVDWSRELFKLYVRPFSPNSGEVSSSSGGKWMISREGGVFPHWRADGKQLFYLDLGGQMMAVDVTADKVLQNRNPQSGYSTRVPRWLYPTTRVTPDGKRFLFVSTSKGRARVEPFVIVLNWQAALEQQ